MSAMHWEKRNREKKVGIPLSEPFRRQPGWKDKPTPIAFRRWPEHDHVPAHDNAGRAENAKRKARITLPKISILKP